MNRVYFNVAFILSILKQVLYPTKYRINSVLKKATYSVFFDNAENNTNGKHFNIEHIYKILKALGIPMSELIDIPTLDA